MQAYDFFLHSLALRPGVPAWVPIALLSIFATLSVAVIREDVKKQRIPNWFNYALILSGLVLTPALYRDYGTHYVAAGITLFIFVVLAEVSRGGMGYGDVKLYTGIALYYSSLAIVIIALSNSLALIASVVLAAHQKRSIRKFPVPMAPFILSSAFIFTVAALLR